MSSSIFRRDTSALNRARAVDKGGNTVDFLFRAKRDMAASRRLFEKAIGQDGSPETATIDKSGANLAALNAVNAARETPIKIRQIKYLNNIVEQGPQAIKRRTRPMLGFKDFNRAGVILSGIELMHMIKKGQVKCSGELRRLLLLVGFLKPSFACHLCMTRLPYREKKSIDGDYFRDLLIMPQMQVSHRSRVGGSGRNPSWVASHQVGRRTTIRRRAERKRSRLGQPVG